MRPILASTPILLVCAALVAGCSSGLLDPKAGATRATAVPVGNDLALPPDLALRAPGQTTDAYIPNGPVAALEEDVAAPTLARQAAPAAPGRTLDIYEKYGISMLRADGTKKDQQELSAELKKAILAEKRKTNPGYGTIWNIGSIFSDG